MKRIVIVSANQWDVLLRGNLSDGAADRLMMFALFHGRTVLESDQNRVDLMILQPSKGAPHRRLELLDGNASQNVIRAYLPQNQVRQLQRDLIHDPLGRLRGDFAADAAVADEEVLILERSLQNVLKLERVGAVERRRPDPERG